MCLFVVDYNLAVTAVHRIGRTGRCGKTGIATTFVNKLCGKMMPQISWFMYLLPYRGVCTTGSKGSVNGSQPESTSISSPVGCSQ